MSQSAPSSDTRSAILDVQELTVDYRRRSAGATAGADAAGAAVGGVSFAVYEGQIVALIGESGSGKTSLALATSRLGEATSGVINFQDHDLVRLSARALRRIRPDMQMIFQNPHGSFDPRQTMQSALRELRRLHRDRSDWTTDENLLRRVGLDETILGRLPSEMSGGQVQRMAVARALLTRPQLLIADEPTSALDVSVQAQILELLVSLTRTERIAILLITHNLAVARHVADYVYVMRRGVFVEQGETEKVLSDPQHEYTRALVGAIPGKNAARTTNPQSQL